MSAVSTAASRILFSLYCKVRFWPSESKGKTDPFVSLWLKVGEICWIFKIWILFDVDGKEENDDEDVDFDKENRDPDEIDADFNEDNDFDESEPSEYCILFIGICVGVDLIFPILGLFSLSDIAWQWQDLGVFISCFSFSIVFLYKI